MNAHVEHIHQIQQNAAEVIKNLCGAVIEVTCRGDFAWTISGAHDQVECAIGALVSAGFCSVEETVKSEELDESFAYIKVRS